MAKMTWDKLGERLYETGVSEVALFPLGEDGNYAKGVAWNGVTAITESPSGAEATPLFADNIKYLNLMSNEEYGATVEAYTYPPEFEKCNGFGELAKGVSIGQQARTGFAFCYKTVLGNDVKSNEFGYKLHIVYGCLAAPSEKAYTTVSDSPEAMTMSWEISTTPVNVTGFKPTSCVVIDSTKADATKLAALEAKLYGTESEEPTLVLPDELKTMMTPAA